MASQSIGKYEKDVFSFLKAIPNITLSIEVKKRLATRFNITPISFDILIEKYRKEGKYAEN